MSHHFQDAFPNSATADELASLRAEVDELRKQADYYRSIFENVAAPILEENFSGVKAAIDTLRLNGTTDIIAHFQSHPGEFIECLKTIDDKFTANQAFLSLFAAESQQDIVGDDFYRIMQEAEAFDSFMKLFAALAAGETRVSMRTNDMTLDGRPVLLYSTWVVAPGYEETWGRVILSSIPLRELADVIASPTNAAPQPQWKT